MYANSVLLSHIPTIYKNSQQGEYVRSSQGGPSSLWTNRWFPGIWK
jgi:hypothetical protein